MYVLELEIIYHKIEHDQLFIIQFLQSSRDEEWNTIFKEIKMNG